IQKSNDFASLIWLVPTFVTAGHSERALELTQLIPDDGRDQAYLGIVEAMVSRQNVDEALALAEKIERREPHQKALATVVVGYANCSRFDDALAFLDRVEIPVQYARGLIATVRELVRTGKLAEAQAAVGRLETLEERSKPYGTAIVLGGEPETVDTSFVSSY